MSVQYRSAAPFMVAIVLLTMLHATTSALAQTNSPPPASNPSQLLAPAPAGSQASASASRESPLKAQRQAYQLPPEKLAKAIALSNIRYILQIAGSVWGLAFIWLLLATRSWPRIEAFTQRRTSRRWLQGIWFFVIFFLLSEIAGLPLDLYGHHAGRAYGISVQSWAGWFADQAKALGLTLVFGTLILLLFNWIVRRWPRRYWLGLWLVTVPILILAIFVEPVVIEPLFNNFHPLQQSNPRLVAQLERVVARTGANIPPQRMFLMDAGAKTNGLNAYVSGIGATRRIVVWDTTAGRIPDDEVLFIFGHESGHYVLNHIWKGLLLSIATMFFVYWACAAAAAALLRRFGPRWSIAEITSRSGTVVLLFVISIAGFIMEPASNAISRLFEHQADIYGQEAIHGIVADPRSTAVAAFNALGEAWLEDPSPNPFIEFWLFSHPSTQNRATFAARYNPWVNGGKGRYFAR